MLSTPPSPTPGAQGLPSSLSPSLAPSPLRPNSRNASPPRSPSHEPPPIHSLLTRAHLMFPVRSSPLHSILEELEKWTVGHVRALEKRMPVSDVDGWSRRRMKCENYTARTSHCTQCYTTYHTNRLPNPWISSPPPSYYSYTGTSITCNGGKLYLCDPSDEPRAYL
jgi:hypothetical protein